MNRHHKRKHILINYMYIYIYIYVLVCTHHTLYVNGKKEEEEEGEKKSTIQN